MPHGMSVIVNAPSVFRFTAEACPERHLQGAEWLGADARGASEKDAGEVLAMRLIELMRATGIPNGSRRRGLRRARRRGAVRGRARAAAAAHQRAARRGERRPGAAVSRGDAVLVRSWNRWGFRCYSSW